MNDMNAQDSGVNEETRAEYEAPTASEIEVTGGTIEAAPVVGISCYR